MTLPTVVVNKVRHVMYLRRQTLCGEVLPRDARVPAPMHPAGKGLVIVCSACFTDERAVS